MTKANLAPAELMEELASAIDKLENYFSKLNEREIAAIKQAQYYLQEDVFEGGYYDDNGRWHDGDY